MQKRYLIIGVFIFYFFLGNINVFAQKEQIKIINANSLEFNKKIGEGVRRLIGDVIFEHNNATMYCDSAYLFSKQNRFHAYSKVHVIRGDSLHMYGDFLFYDGNTDVGKVRNNVRLLDKETVLYTDSLDFNTVTNIAYYYDGGKIVSGANNLESKVGYYYANDDMFFYKDSVVVTSPDYVIYTDTLKYNTESKIAYFLGPTNIFNEENHLYAENGWYNTGEKKFQFNKNAIYQNKEKILKGDSLYYDDLNGIGIAVENIEMIDTSENVILKGNYAYYVKEPESFRITDSSMLIQVSAEQDSLYLHADTITSNYDISGTYRILKAYHKVQIFRKDFQARCDSLVYSFKDSTIHMFVEPILWSEGNQITSEKVEVYTKNEKIDFFKLLTSAFIVSQEDTSSYNQIRGKDMFGFIRNNRLYKVDVYGNGQTIYYTKDNQEVVGINYAESSDLIIYINNNEVNRIILLKEPSGVLYPPEEIKGFRWLEHLRPKTKTDIFFWK